MNKWQKKACFCLVGFMLNLIAGGILAAVLPTDDPANVKFRGVGIYQMQAYGLWQAVFLVIIVLGEYFFRKRPGDIIDERDHQISQKATATASSVFWIAFGVACAALVVAYGPLNITVPAQRFIIPLIVGGLVIFTSAYSITILTQYGRKGPEVQP